MSILIKGMAMPKNCEECPFYYENKHDRGDDSFCLVSGKEAKCGCPLVPIQPHGDLIDRDKLETHHGWYNEDRERNVVQTHIQFVYANAILTAPVVVESEE